MTQRLEVAGDTSSNSLYVWDDGSDHDDVTKIYVRCGLEGIQFVKFDYIKSGQPKEGSFQGFSGNGLTQMFELNHLKGEHLVSVEGYWKALPNWVYQIQGLQFKTNLRSSEFMGYETSYKFTLAVEGKKIIGFHGCAKYNLTALGAYFTQIAPTRLQAKGGNGGMEWDDGARDYESVAKIHVKCGLKSILNIKFDYVDKDGNLDEGQVVHGSTLGKGFTLEPFEINHLEKEYLLSVEGYYDENSGVIQALQFRTNVKTSELMGLDDSGIKFSLGLHGMKIIAFHGFADKNLNSLGAYFLSLPLTKLEEKGGHLGSLWDDGSFQGVRKVNVYSDTHVRCIRFEYDNDSKVEVREHGSKLGFLEAEKEFVLDYPNEFLTSVEGTFTKLTYSETCISSLIFKTSKGRASLTFGNPFAYNHVNFVLKNEGCALVGFHGRSLYTAIESFGAYSRPMPSHDADKVETQGDLSGV